MPNDLVQWRKLQLPKTVERKQFNTEEKIAESLSAKNVIVPTIYCSNKLF